MRGGAVACDEGWCTEEGERDQGAGRGAGGLRGRVTDPY